MVRPFTKPDDVHGMIAAKGILTSEGGATSHAAVVARQFGKPCVVGAASIKIDMAARTMTADGVTVKEGDWISVDGGTGEAFLGQIPTVAPKFEEQTDLITLLSWADEIAAEPGSRVAGQNNSPTRGLQVWANADYPADARRARTFGAQGIGLCRTEHMFFEAERLPIVQRMILAKSSEERTAALNELLPFQRSDFDGLFEAMTGLPVIIRLIDPPLHEFLPDEEKLLEEVIAMRVKGETEGLAEKEALLTAIRGMHESNPMMGLRGIRLSIIMPEIVEMQVRAIFEAACDVKLRGFDPHVEVMIPLTGTVNELKVIQPKLERIAKAVMAEKGTEVDYKFGTMIEIPRAAVTAAEIAGPNGRVLQLRHQRPDPDDLRLQPRRRRAQLPAQVRRRRHPALQPVPDDRPGRRGPADGHLRGGRPQGPPGPRGRHLRRARRRPQLHRVVPPDRQQLRELLAVPCAGGPPGRRAGGDQARAEEVTSRLVDK